MSTKEKQATLKAAFVFLVPLENEQPAKAGGRARQRGLVIEEEKRELITISHYFRLQI